MELSWTSKDILGKIEGFNPYQKKFRSMNKGRWLFMGWDR